METYKLKWTKLQREIFRFLSINADKSFNLRTIAKKLKVSPTAVSKAVELLKNGNIVAYKKDPKLNLASVEFNRDSSLAIGLKRADNLSLLYECGIVQYFYDSFPGATLILFGSYSLGEDTFNSDIDIAVIGTKEKSLVLDKFQNFLQKEINITFYENLNIKKELKNNILNGIILKGSVEV